MSSPNYDELMQPVIEFLGCQTPQAWLNEALNNLELLMQDHANCEKSSRNSHEFDVPLQFFYRFTGEVAQLVREEMLHYEQVLELMKKRGQEWKAVSAGRYAGELRKQIRTYEPEALIDVLIIGAFVEARSCERFHALAPHVDDELGRYYRYLLKSESRHFEDYLALALEVAQTAKMKNPEEDIQQRIVQIREVEKNLILSADKVFRFHSGVPEAQAA